MDTKKILEILCAEKGISGRENEMSDIVKQLLGDFCKIRTLTTGTVIAEMCSNESSYHIMLDAHIDRIGLTVTYIDENGFLCVEPVGGIDLRSLPGKAVTVGNGIMGVICTMPPHLDKDDSGLDRSKIRVDTGLPTERVRELVKTGDSVILKSKFRELLNDRIAVSALDNRAGCAVLVKCAEMLRENQPPCRVSFVFSSQEETNESGAKTAAFILQPDEAVVVDVGFAKQDGVPSDKSGAVGCGGIISIAPVLSKNITDRLISIAENRNINCDFEVDGGGTGTNADGIAVTAGGIPCGVISVPEKNMHTQTECVSVGDIEACAVILSDYVMGEGIRNV